MDGHSGKRWSENDCGQGGISACRPRTEDRRYVPVEEIKEPEKLTRV